MRRWTWILGVVLALVLVGPRPASSQFPPILPTPEPTPSPSPAATAPPTTTPEATPSPSVAPVPTVPVETESPPDTPSPSPKPTPKEDLPSGLEAPAEEIVVPVLPRTRARSTRELVDLLRPLAEAGVQLEQVLIDGMGRFPVAGSASYSDDWLFPRFNPYFHLHHGLDIFADFGTPVRAPDAGTVTRMTRGPVGGVGVWTSGLDGTAYYFAHLLEWADGLEVGQTIEVGTVLGFVGDTGNARGGSPHVHLEVHRGGAAVPPKPSVDRWLDEAIELAPGWVRTRLADLTSKRELLRTDRPWGQLGSPGLDAPMMATLLDPVAGSVGLLPRLDIDRRRSPVSKRLLDELVLRRVDGFALVPAVSLGD